MKLADLAEIGIVARLDDAGSLVLDAPAGVLQGELLGRLRAAKPALVAEIRRSVNIGEHCELHPSMFTRAGKGCTARHDLHAVTWRLHFADRDPVELHCWPALTHAEALAEHPEALAAEPAGRGTSASTASASEHSELLALVQAIYASDTDADRQQPGCPTCHHMRKPGKSTGYCAGGRADLVPAYGANHPLRRLPADGGTDCQHFQPAKWVIR